MMGIHAWAPLKKSNSPSVKRNNQDVRAGRPHHKETFMLGLLTAYDIATHRPHIADDGPVPFRSSILNFA